MTKENRTTLHHASFRPYVLNDYFRREAVTLTIVTISGILYNVGLLSGPYFEGKLLDALNTHKQIEFIIRTSVIFLCFITGTQIFRSLKRFYVRRFANNTLKTMRTSLYHNILLKKLNELEQENTGTLMSKTIGDVDACVEGMRKFTTELFDTGVFMIAYLVMMCTYDLRLTLVASAFIALALCTAEIVKKPVYTLTSSWRKSAAQLNSRTFELIDNASLYRIYGLDARNRSSYAVQLDSYAHKAAKSTISENAMEPIYATIVMGASVFIIILGAKNVTAATWSVGRFTAYLSLFAGLASKASHAGKLFNSVQKASVSWKRIKPYLSESESGTDICATDDSRSNTSIHSVQSVARADIPAIKVDSLSFAFKDNRPLFSNVTFNMLPGTITGVTGPVACGKSILAHLFLGPDGPQSAPDATCSGSILLYDKPIGSYDRAARTAAVGCMFHNSALFSGTIYDNITLGNDGPVDKVLHAVCFDQDIEQMKDGVQTVVGNGGIRLSGGQQARLALARTLYHKGAVLILDDPFAAVDPATEAQILLNIRAMPVSVLLISHRLHLFNTLDSIVVMHGDGSAPDIGTHDELLKKSAEYRSLYNEQNGADAL